MKKNLKELIEELSEFSDEEIVNALAERETGLYLSVRNLLDMKIGLDTQDDAFIDPVTGLDWFPVFVHQKNTEGIVCQFFDSEGQADHTDPVRIKRQLRN